MSGVSEKRLNSFENIAKMDGVLFVWSLRECKRRRLPLCTVGNSIDFAKQLSYILEAKAQTLYDLVRPQGYN